MTHLRASQGTHELPTVRAVDPLFGDERETAFFLLKEVQLQQGVQPVEAVGFQNVARAADQR
jgi:hypothetical protein